MTDDHGKLRLTYDGSSYEFSFGTITGISDSFMKSASTTPIPSMKASSAFTIESKTSKTITISFTRKQPANAISSGSDTTRWSNGHWVSTIKKAIDRWQCKTDGFHLSYDPAADNPYISPIEEDGYIKNFSVAFSQAIPEKIKGSFEFHIGGMYMKSTAADPEYPDFRYQEQFKVIIYNSTNTAQNQLLAGSKDPDKNQSCIDSMTIRGGPECPFEYLTMTIPRKKLMKMAPNLFKTVNNFPVCDIVAGRNVLELTLADGDSSMIVTKVKLSNNNYTITAYCKAERIRGTVLSADETLTPAEWVKAIITETRFLGFSSSNFIRQYSETSSDTVGNIKFNAGTNVWYILQVCAMCMGARVFFANNKAYVIDYNMPGSNLINYGKVDLYPVAKTGDDGRYYSAVTGQVDLGDEGVDTIVNSVSISCMTPVMKDGVYDMDDQKNILFTSFNYYVYSDDASVGKFQERAANTISLPELKQNDPNNMPEEGEIDDIEPEAEGLELRTSSVKKIFYQGDEFTYAGLRVYEITDEGRVRLNLEDCSISEPNMYKIGAQEVRVSYNDKYATYIIVVKLPVFKQAETFAKNYISYRSEPQQSISFTLREMRKKSSGQAWHPFFGPASVSGAIIDSPDDTYIDNVSVIDSKPKYPKLALSSYERQYPAGKTTYHWGVLNTIDLSSSTSQITTSLGSIRN